MPVTLDDRFDAIAQGKVDLVCASDTVTLERRKQDLADPGALEPVGAGGWSERVEVEPATVTASRPRAPGGPTRPDHQ